ncbi:hypothetical protein RYX36_021211 [Vicia faba]
MDQVDFNAPYSMGTTIISVTYNDKVILGADSRTSIDTPFINPNLNHSISPSLALGHSKVEGISRLTTLVPGTDESNRYL